jgi:hypothetical protein
VPYEYLKLFDVVGFKDWFTFVGSEVDLLHLRDYIRNQAGYSELDAIGIRVFQHHEHPEFKFPDNKVGYNVHLTLDFDHLPSRFADMFQMVVQRGGTLVYTDSLMHVGRGICSFNSAWNVFPSSLCKRTDRTLGTSSPLAFNHRSAELARSEVAAVFHLRPGGMAHMLQGSYDTLSHMLAKTVFCASNNLHLSAKLAEGCVEPETVMRLFHEQKKEICAFQLLHKEADNQLHRVHGARILREGCVPRPVVVGGKRQRCTGSELKYKTVSAERASVMHLASYLCTGCGVAMLLNKLYCPESNYAPEAPDEPPVSLCSWCAQQCCEVEDELVLVEVMRESIIATGFEHIEHQQFQNFLCW